MTFSTRYSARPIRRYRSGPGAVSPTILRSDGMQERFEDAVEEETDEDEKPVTTLKKLLDAGEFDENNKEHLALARGFLERSMVVC